MPGPLFGRREILRLGAVSVFAGAGKETLASPTGGAISPAPNAKAKSCIFMLLQGGPSHIDLYDPKPDAPAEARGPFSPIATASPGVRVGEVMTHLARIMPKITMIRSMEHRFSNHIAGTYIMLTGSTNQPDADREAHPDDFPGPGAVLNWLEREPRATPVSVSLPTWLSIPGPSNRMPGQYGGFLGSTSDPFLISGQPESPDFRPLRLAVPPEIGGERFGSRINILQQLDQSARFAESQALRSRDRLYETACAMLTDERVRRAIDLSLEPTATRHRYGMTKIGQSLLLARRLVEAGVRFVGFNEFNQHWDHHGNVRDTLRHHGPRMDQAFAALIEDLDDRGLLDSTLVINTGEFGRTPIINKDGGRDHWPFAYTTLVAGGGVARGLVHGASDSRGAYVARSPVSPADLLATLWTQLGVDPQTELVDRLGRPMVLSTGTVVREIV